MSQRGLEHSQHPAEEPRLDASRAISLTKDYAELFVIECYEQMDVDVLQDFVDLLRARLAELDDSSSPSEERDVLELIQYAESAQWAIQYDFELIENHANGYSDTEK